MGFISSRAYRTVRQLNSAGGFAVVSLSDSANLPVEASTSRDDLALHHHEIFRHL